MQRGSLKVIKNRHGVKVWRLQWRENGRGRTRILGTVRGNVPSGSRRRAP